MKSKRPKPRPRAQIDSNVPLPIKSDYPSPSGRRIYPWLEIEVGESFLLRSPNNSGGHVSYANRRYAPRHFISSRTHEGTRIWRDK
jgi:hypothetical protein